MSIGLEAQPHSAYAYTLMTLGLALTKLCALVFIVGHTLIIFVPMLYFGNN